MWMWFLLEMKRLGVVIRLGARYGIGGKRVR
jgi:hypothetical protein